MNKTENCTFEIISWLENERGLNKEQIKELKKLSVRLKLTLENLVRKITI